MDPNNAIILKVEPNSVVSDEGMDAKEAIETTTKVEMKVLKMKQEKITEFFRKTEPGESRFGLAAVSASGSADFVSSNESSEPQKQT